MTARGGTQGGGWVECVRRALLRYTEHSEAANMEESDPDLHGH